MSSVVQNLCALALRQVVKAASQTIGVDGDAAFEAIQAYFTDQSSRLTRALQNANERAWQALELALAGDSFWERVQKACTRAEDKAFGQQVRTFLDAAPLPELAGKSRYRQAVLDELKASRKVGVLTAGAPDVAGLARQAVVLARFADPQALLDADQQAIRDVAAELKMAGYTNLAWFLNLKPRPGDSLLVIAVRYFFRREVEGDAELFRGLTWSTLDRLGKAQEDGFASLAEALAKHATRVAELLQGVRETVEATHGKVLDLREEQCRQGGKLGDIYGQVEALHRRFDLLARDLRPGDSLSIRGDAERQIVKALIGRFRALPPQQQGQLPALLNALGKLELLAGEPAAAQEIFESVVRNVKEPPAQAEAHFNAYQAALERRDLGPAFREFLEAVKLDGPRFSPFPVRKYRPQRILGAGGFGITFLCQHDQLGHDVVVKVLRGDGLARNMDEVFDEARALNQLRHDGVIRVIDCAYALPREKERPYFVMEYFDGKTLQEYAQARHLSEKDCLAVARLMADGLKAAHDKKILHRDVKPANVMVRRDGANWQVKVIDFGLALRADAQHETRKDAETPNRPPAAGDLAGTFDYAAPEQMGQRPGVAAGPYSDIYGLARTCCYAMFGTPQPLRKHWESISAPLAKLLGDCLEDDPTARPADCATLIARLRTAEQATPAGGTGWDLWSALQAAIVPGAAPPSVRVIGPPKAPPEATPSGVVSVVEPFQKIKAHDGKVLFVTFAPEGGRLLSAGDDGTVRLWRREGLELACLRPPKGWLKPAAVVYAAFTPDARRAFSVAADGMVRLWNLNTGAEVRSFALWLGVTSAALSPDGRRLLVGGRRSVTLWDVEQGRLLRRFGGGTGQLKGDVHCVAFTPQGGVLAGGLDGVVHVYDGGAGAGQFRLEGHGGGVYAVAPHPNGRHTLAGAGDHRLYVWDTERGQGWAFAGHAGEVFGVAVSPDGRLALTGGADQTVLLWRGWWMVDGEEGKLTGGADQTALLWLLKGWEKTGRLVGHTDQVRCVAFSPNGRQAVSGGDDGTIRVWPVGGA